MKIINFSRVGIPKKLFFKSVFFCPKFASKVSTKVSPKVDPKVAPKVIPKVPPKMLVLILHIVTICVYFSFKLNFSRQPISSKMLFSISQT